jgi:uncharacterized protein (DUF305 family)
MNPPINTTGVTRAALVAAAMAAAAITLAACSSSGGSGSQPSSSSMSSAMSMSTMPGSSSAAQGGAPATGPHNSADITFATDMIPHHAQALQMAKMARTKATHPQVTKLAQAIEGAQTPAITAMSGWLKGWNQPVPDTSMGGMNMGGTSMPGMMSSAEMAKLNTATGRAFDKLWLTQMIAHHQGAVTMANTEVSAGQNTDAQTLARSIITGQNKEIATMKTLRPTIR